MESKKSSNVSSDQTRALSGIKLHGKNYVEKSYPPLLIWKLNSSRKLDISGDKNTMKEIGKHKAFVQQFESLLLSSYSQGVKDFSILQEELAADKPVASAAKALFMCKLPRTQFRQTWKKIKSFRRRVLSTIKISTKNISLNFSQ